MNFSTGLEGFSGRLAVLPLANTVFLPGALLPVRLFDERHIAMVRDVMQGDRLVGVALLRDGWEVAYAENPAIHGVLGIGQIVASQDLPSGRLNALIHGLARGRVADEISGRTYRQARVQVLTEHRSRSHLIERFARRALVRAFRDLLEVQPETLLVWDRYRLFDAPLGLLTDHLASNLVLAPRVKQAILEETHVVRRATKLAKAIRANLFALESRTREESVQPIRTSQN